MVFVLLSLCACNDKSTQSHDATYSDKPPISEQVHLFGIHPMFNPVMLSDVYQPLIDYLNARLKSPKFQFEASRDFATYEEKLYSRRFEIAFPNSMQIVEATSHHGYHVFAKIEDDSQFRGIIIVRKDSGIKEVSDLKGKTVSYAAPTALAATMLPQEFLFQNGIDLRHDIHVIYANTPQSSIMNVFLGKSAAATAWPPAWIKFQKDEPDKAAALEVKWQTHTLPHNGLIARDDLPADLVAQVKGLLIGLEETEEGRALLTRIGVTRFVSADDATYEPVRQYVRWFSANIRRPEEP